VELVHLIGAEAVQRAGGEMQRAAEQMFHAARNIEAALNRHAMKMEECTTRIEMLERARRE